jgi:hypothetical protein
MVGEGISGGTVWEGEAPAEPQLLENAARREPRPPVIRQTVHGEDSVRGERIGSFLEPRLGRRILGREFSELLGGQ